MECNFIAQQLRRVIFTFKLDIVAADDDNNLFRFRCLDVAG